MCPRLDRILIANAQRGPGLRVDGISVAGVAVGSILLRLEGGESTVGECEWDAAPEAAGGDEEAVLDGDLAAALLAVAAIGSEAARD